MPLPILIGGILILNSGLIFFACRTPLPDLNHPLRFYSNQTRHDIKRTFLTALKGATESIYLSVYGISDPHLIELLERKSQGSIPIRIEYDKGASANLKQLLPPQIDIQPIKTKGLMHRKIAVLDHKQIFLGSANFTTTSLKYHANLVVGLYHKELAAYLEHPFSNSFSFTIEGLKGFFFLLPDPSQNSLKMLLKTLNAAKKTIRIAMFTLTHSEIAAALIEAKRRGVDVAVAIDYYTARGASKKTLEKLKKEGITLYLSQGKELLHHKWGFIDDSSLIMGSANWTRAAFTKNHDFLLFLSHLNASQQQFFKQLWDIIETESICPERI